MHNRLFTSESVTEGHPDKVCDIIADSILDEVLSADPAARVACEALIKDNTLIIAGEVTSTYACHYALVAQQVLSRIGYRCGPVRTLITHQSPDIASGIVQSIEQRSGSKDPLDAQGAGDQGLMFGYACIESELLHSQTYMPLPIYIAHQLAQQLSRARRENLIPGLLPDGKTQVSAWYSGGMPTEIRSIVISTHHEAHITQSALREAIFYEVIRPILHDLCGPDRLSAIEYLCNPAGPFLVGGPEADSGLTGRKIIVDTYGGMARHGGGSFSGKDPSKVDRSASYYARYVAKNLVAAGLARRAEIQVSYAIGRARPLSISLDTFGTERHSIDRLMRMLNDPAIFDFRPRAIIQQLDLLNVRYADTAVYGHFGRPDLALPWERLDKVQSILSYLGITS